MSSSRRHALSCVRPDDAQHAPHPGLWLDRFIEGFERGGERTPQSRLVDEVAGLGEPKPYAAHFARWRRALSALGAETRLARVRGRVVVGLGAESVLETAIALHRTYGVPYLPGSALKGLAAAYARQRLEGGVWGCETEAYRVLFGDTTAAGYVTFFDALYEPGSGHDGRPLHADVLTVHHPDYYQRGGVPPADWDRPNPVPFLTATGRYLVALAGPPKWVAAAFAILESALSELGIGAKTSSGYGRLALLNPANRPVDQSEAEPARRGGVAPAVARQLARPEAGEPVPGATLRGRVRLKQATAVQLELEGYPPERYLGLLRADRATISRYRVGQAIEVRVISCQAKGSGLIEVTVESIA